MYLSNVPEQGLTSYERNGKGTILLGSRMTFLKDYKMKKFIYFALLLKEHIKNSMKGRIIPSKMKDYCLGNNSFFMVLLILLYPRFSIERCYSYFAL